MKITLDGESFEVNLGERTVYHPATQTTVGFYESQEQFVGRFSPMEARRGSDQPFTLAQIALATQVFNKVAA